MTVGDLVFFNATSATTYQPAAGVEIIILSIFVSNSATTYYGTFQSGLVRNRNYSAQLPYANNKFGITNTDYFEFNVLNGNTGFCGIQIK